MADGRDSYIRKGVYQRFVLGVSELRKLKSIVKEQGNGRCPLGMLYASLCYTCSATPRRVSRANHIHIGVGFCVVRSTMEGNAKAQIRGTATVQTPALFRIYAQHFSIKTFPARGVCRKQRKTNMEKVTFTLVRSGMAAIDFPTTDEAMNAVKQRTGTLKGMGESYEWDKDGTARKFTIAWVEEDETHNLFAVDSQCMRSDI